MDTGTEIRKILEVTRVELTHYAENENKQGIIECLGRLHQLLGRDVEEAVKLVNGGYVKVIQDISSGRKIIRVTSKSATEFYHLFPLINYCPCPEFKEFVIDAKLKFMIPPLTVYCEMKSVSSQDTLFYSLKTSGNTSISMLHENT